LTHYLYILDKLLPSIILLVGMAVEFI